MLVQTEISRSVSWLAMHGSATLKSAAKAVQRALPASLSARMDQVLTDGYGMEDRRWDRVNYQERWNESIKSLVSDIHKAFPDNARLVSEIDNRLDRARKADPERSATPEVLVGQLVNDVEGFADAVLDAAFQRSSSHVAKFSGYALAHVFRGDKSEGRRRIREFMTSDSLDLKTAVSTAYGNLRYNGDWFTTEDEVTLQTLLASDDPGLVLSAVRAGVRPRVESWFSPPPIRCGEPTSQPGPLPDEVATLFEFGTNS